MDYQETVEVIFEYLTSVQKGKPIVSNHYENSLEMCLHNSSGLWQTYLVWSLKLRWMWQWWWRWRVMMSCDMMNKGDISIKDGLRPGDRPYINCPSIWTTSYFINGCIIHCTYISYHPVHFHKATFTSKLHCATLNIQSMSPMCVLYRLSCS